MQLLSDEIELSHLDKVTLTNLRIYSEVKSWFGNKNNKVIFLEDINYMEPDYKNPFWLLILGALSVLLALYLRFNFGGTDLGKFYYFAAGCVLLWWLFRKYAINVISSSCKEISFTVDWFNKKKIENFITEIQQAKLNRVNELHQKGQS